MWGASSIAFELLQGDLFATRPMRSYAQLADTIEKNPNLIRMAKERSLLRARANLAESESTPDLRISLGGRRAEGPNAFGVVFGISAPIPIFDRNRSTIGSLKKADAALAADQDAQRVRVLEELYGRIQELSHAREELRAIHSEILPEAEDVLKLVTEGFRAGRLAQIELLDAERTLLELEKERIDAAENMWMHAARIQNLVGAPALEVSASEHERSQEAGEQHE